MNAFLSNPIRIRMFVFTMILLALAIMFFVSTTVVVAGPATSQSCC